jgi:hypothetical protein
MPSIRRIYSGEGDRMTQHDVPFHPACLIFPPLPAAEFDALIADIAARGLIHPIVTLGNQVLDGRNRLLACRRAGVKPRFVQWRGTGSPLAWAISANVQRRHLTASQRAVLALDLLPHLEAEGALDEVVAQFHLLGPVAAAGRVVGSGCHGGLGWKVLPRGFSPEG